MVFAQGLEKLYQEIQSKRPEVFGLVYCCYDAPYNRTPFLR